MIVRNLVICILWLLLAVPVSAQEREGGIIGTGLEPAGIVGPVTHLGSIWVNGQHIRFDPDLAVTESIGPRRAADLRPGHIVAVVAVPEGDGWRARHIRQVAPLVGPVSAVGEGRLVVLGTTVLGPSGGVAVGDRVAVSGVWRGDEVIATRLDPAGEAPDQVSGTYLGGSLRLGGTDIKGIDPRHLQPGEMIRAVGLSGRGGLLADRLERGLFAEPVVVVQAEGYTSPPRPDGLYTVLGSGLVAYTAAPASMRPDQSAVFCGTAGPLAGDPPPPDPSLARRLGCPVPGADP